MTTVNTLVDAHPQEMARIRDEALTNMQSHSRVALAVVLRDLIDRVERAQAEGRQITVGLTLGEDWRPDQGWKHNEVNGGCTIEIEIAARPLPEGWHREEKKLLRWSSSYDGVRTTAERQTA